MKFFITSGPVYDERENLLLPGSFIGQVHFQFKGVKVIVDPAYTPRLQRRSDSTLLINVPFMVLQAYMGQPYARNFTPISEGALKSRFEKKKHASE